MNKEAVAKGGVLASAGTIAVTFLITVVSEVNAGFTAFLKANFTHHWIGKSILSIVVFAVLFVVFYSLKPKISLVLSTWLLIISGAVFSFLLFVFFVLETFGIL